MVPGAVRVVVSTIVWPLEPVTSVVVRVWIAEETIVWVTVLAGRVAVSTTVVPPVVTVLVTVEAGTVVVVVIVP